MSKEFMSDLLKRIDKHLNEGKNMDQKIQLSLL